MKSKRLAPIIFASTSSYSEGEWGGMAHTNDAQVSLFRPEGTEGLKLA